MSSHWLPAVSTLEVDDVAGVPMESLGPETKVLTGNLKHDPLKNKPIVMPIHHSAVYKVSSVREYEDILRDGGFIYGRLGNPNCQDAESRIRNLEGGAGTLVFSNGMSCISTTLLGVLKPGDHVVCHFPIFMDEFLTKVMQKYNIEVSWVKPDAGVRGYRHHVKSNTKLLIGETPSHPQLHILDLEAFGQLGKELNILTMVDTTFASPMLVQPMKYGIDFVVQSGSKYMGGHNDCLAGVLTVRDQDRYKDIQVLRATMGTTISSFEATLLTRGLKTLPMRMKQHCESTQKIAEFLAGHPKVARVYYPSLPSHPNRKLAMQQMSGFAGMLSFEIKDGHDAAKQFVESVHLFSLAISMGGAESLILHPASMTHGPLVMSQQERDAALITDSLIRISVGLESVEDLINDLKQAFDSVDSDSWDMMERGTKRLKLSTLEWLEKNS